MGVAIALFTKATVFDETGVEIKKYLYLDASIQYFGPVQHLVGIVGTLNYFIFVFFPFFYVGLSMPLSKFFELFCLHC